MSLRFPNRANGIRSLFFLSLICVFAACSAETPTPTPEPPAPTALVVVVTATRAPATATNEPTATVAPSITLPPTVESIPTVAMPTPLPPTDIPPTAVPTAEPIVPTSAPSPIPATAVPPEAGPTLPPTAVPTDVPPAPPPAAFTATELMTIPEGVLRMGSPNNDDYNPDEKPQHDVHMGTYLIEKYEVTNAQYDACVAAGRCSPAGQHLNGENFPIVNVTWYQADAYCKWIGRRLPNEAEWERAGRGMDNWDYSWSNRPAPHFEWQAQFNGSPLSFCEASCALPHFIEDVNDGFPSSAPIGSFSQTEPRRRDISEGFEVADMNGNVAEWVQNWYDPTAYQQGYPVDVFGPDFETGSKVYRGSSWATEPRRLATRFSLPPDQARDDLGFRCAQ